MHLLEPFFYWREYYVASDDSRSPFYGREYSEFEFTNKIYNHLIHPQWDAFESPTLLCKILFTDYDYGFTIIEMMGEWNDLMDNDFKLFKEEVLEPMVQEGINHFILIGENILNFHGDMTDYYEEFFDELDDGFMAFIGFREHVLQEFYDLGLDAYFISGGELDTLPWRTMNPVQNFNKIKGIYNSRLGFS